MTDIELQNAAICWTAPDEANRTGLIRVECRSSWDNALSLSQLLALAVQLTAVLPPNTVHQARVFGPSQLGIAPDVIDEDFRAFLNTARGMRLP